MAPRCLLSTDHFEYSNTDLYHLCSLLSCFMTLSWSVRQTTYTVSDRIQERVPYIFLYIQQSCSNVNDF